ncbi:hypothetical protein HK096_002823 [Nowakowskiella sp. JEL0078]|nr:hypothetical protein HK096_002823 [Nowakowskiella sp. JEL0078]
MNSDPSGTLCSVVAAFDTVRKEDVAVKIFVKSALTQSQAADVVREVNIQSNLDHSNIVRIYEFHETSTHFYLVFEKLDFELFEWIAANGKETEDSSRRIFIQVAKGVQYLHQSAILHRDLKLENLLYNIGNDGKIGTVKICDFGLSKQIKTFTSTPVGTPSYTAPEIVLNKKYGKEIDLWSLGCLLYILLTGSQPFKHPGNDYPFLFDSILSGRFDESRDWNNVSKNAQKLIKKLLNVDPRKRGTIEDVLDDTWVKSNENSSVVNQKSTWLSQVSPSLDTVKKSPRKSNAQTKKIETGSAWGIIPKVLKTPECGENGWNVDECDVISDPRTTDAIFGIEHPRLRPKLKPSELRECFRSEKDFKLDIGGGRLFQKRSEM